jgi:hypothetical protein
MCAFRFLSQKGAGVGGWSIRWSTCGMGNRRRLEFVLESFANQGDKLAFPFCRGVGSWSEPSHGWATTVASLGTRSIHAEAWIKIAMITLWCEGSPEHSQTGSQSKWSYIDLTGQTFKHGIRV